MKEFGEDIKPNGSDAFQFPALWSAANSSNSSEANKMNDAMSMYKKIIFVLIAVVAILGNSLFCTVLVRKRASLRHPYNKLLLSLSVTDLLTGILITFTPNFILDKEWLEVPDNYLGEFYCRVIYNRLFLFLLGKASILTATFLAIERWYSVVKPIEYRIAFSSRRLAVSITCIWIASILLQMSKGFSIEPYNGSCRSESSNYNSSQIVAIIYVWVSFFTPSIIIWGTFIHIWTKLRQRRAASGDLQKTTTQRLLGVCGTAACIMTLCWLPIQITYILSGFNIVKLSSTLHEANQMLAMANSCVNPWIFCFANKEYRESVLALFVTLKSCHKSPRNSEVATSSGSFALTELQETTHLQFLGVVTLKLKLDNEGLTNEAFDTKL